MKVAFWTLLILILLPSNTQEKMNFYNTAQRSVSDVSHFCDRNAELCEKTTEFFTGLYQKLLTTTDMIEETLINAGIGGDVRSLQSDDPFTDNYPQDFQRPRPQRQSKGDNLSSADIPSTSSLLRNSSQNTLTQQDLTPTWHGPRRYSSRGRYYR
ncbi:MAG: hypothetical protein P8Y67_00595 [Alphaproteobacteria bacterium]